MKGRAIALLSCMFFGSVAVFQKVLTGYMSPLVLAALTSLSTSVIVVFLLEAKHKACEVTTLTRHDAIMLLSIGLLTGVFAQLLMITGVMYSSATNGVLLTRFNSLLFAMMGVVFLKEKLTKNHIIGFILMVSGVVIIATKNFSMNMKPEIGDVLLIGACFCWSTSNLIMKKYLYRIPPEVLVLGRHIIAATFLTLLVFWIGTEPLNVEATVYVTGYIIFTVLIAQFLWYLALEHTTASNVALASLTIPLFGVLFAVTLLGETLFDYHLIGGALIVLGLIAIETHLSTLKGMGHRIKTIHIPHHH